MSDISITRPEPPEGNPNPETNQPGAAPPSGPLGFLLRVLDVPTLCILAVAWVFLFFYFFAKGGFLHGLGALLLFTILAPVAAAIANLLRKALKPTAVFTSEGFWGLLKVKVFWAVGPQTIAVVACGMLAFEVIPTASDKARDKASDWNSFAEGVFERAARSDWQRLPVLPESAVQEVKELNARWAEERPKRDDLETWEAYDERLAKFNRRFYAEIQLGQTVPETVYRVDDSGGLVAGISYSPEEEELSITFDESRTAGQAMFLRISDQVEGAASTDSYRRETTMRGISVGKARKVQSVLGSLSDTDTVNERFSVGHGVALLPDDEDNPTKIKLVAGIVALVPRGQAGN